ncbi:uncharacterized protein FA14DRAFT_177835 [Meira miltonrushii]|uniref:Ig-like domain-containing protein n=1 Tax=Meira miltonrushii TaxID=1280837 RepID=A0A316VQ77_9BASI|nr:uncharacterized protein FA14DRAFT_177835 [Meira miltonrushii]PWN38573.1 hypothetical protein FA14DRAFT_177835 [Meira miltonrushii]
MFYKTPLILAVVLVAALSVNAKVTYQKGLVPEKAGSGSANTHAFYVVGDRNGYKFSVLKNEAGKWSEATCGNVVQGSKGLGPNGASFYTAPCEVDASTGDQVVKVQCIDPTNPKAERAGSATISWYKGPTQDGQRSYGIHVESQGNIYLGTTLASEQGTPLIQGPFSLGGLQNQGVIINCNGKERTRLAN